MNNVVAIKRNLEKGLYIDNLYDMIGQCTRLARKAKEPLAFYVLAQVLVDIVNDWEDRPLPVAEVQKMEQKISSELKNTLTSICNNRQSQQIWKDLNALLRAFLR